MAVWSPLSQQTAESDTLFMPDLTSQTTINNGGGFLHGDNVVQSSLVSRYDFGAGKFTSAVRAKAGQASYVFYPIDGLLNGDEWTIEYWQKLDISWASHNSGKGLFCCNASPGGNQLNLFNFFGGNIFLSAGSLSGTSQAWNGGASFSVASSGLNDSVFNQFAVTLKNGIITYYVNGVVKATITGANFLPVWSDATREEGVLIGGEPGNPNNVWTSDIRFSRTQRIPSVDVPLRSLTGTMSVNAGNVSGTVPVNFSGSLKIVTSVPSKSSSGAFSIPEAQESVSVIREADTITVTPIKAGGTDATHPTLGQSGQFSYDWQVVDRSLAYMKDRGVEIYLGADSTPQILGGNFAPAPATPLIGYTYSPNVPTNFDQFATMMADLVHHANATNRHITRLSGTNEPEAGNFWSGTISSWMDLFGQWAAKVRAADPTVKIGGPELTSFTSTTWIDALFTKVASGTPMDFFAAHDYSGSLNALDQGRAIVNTYAAAHGVAPPKIAVGEFNWSDVNDQSGFERFRTASINGHVGFWHVRSLVAAYTTSYLIHALDIGNFDSIIYSHSGPTYGTIRTGGKFFSMQMVGDNGEHWAGYNAMKGWKLAINNNRNILLTTKDLPPGVHAVATKNDTSSSFGFVLTNWGWANRTSRTVNITLSNLPSGNYRLRRYLVDEAHSRWDQAEDGAGGAAFDTLAVVEDHTNTAAQLASLSFVLPRWSSTFVTIEAAGGGPPAPKFIPINQVVTTNTAQPVTIIGGSPPPVTYSSVVLQDNPSGYWRLGESSGTNANDETANNNDGTYNNTPTFGVGSALPGDLTNTAITLTAASSEYVSLPNLNVGTNATMEIWFKTTASDGRIFSLNNTSTGAYLDICLSGTRLKGEARSDTGNFAHLDGPFGKNDDVWHYVVLTKIGTALAFYVDATQVATATLNTTVTSNAFDLGRQSINSGQLYYGGSLDEAAYYTGALSQARITVHYNQASSTGTPHVILIGRAIETDTPSILRRVKSKAVGQTSITNTAQTTTRNKSHIVPQLEEIDTARRIIAPQFILIGRAIESSLASDIQGETTGFTAKLGTLLSRLANMQLASGAALSANQIRRVTETDIAQPLTRKTSHLIGQATETETAQPIRPAHSRIIGLVTQVDTPQVLIKHKTKAVGQVLLTNFAQSFSKNVWVPHTVNEVTLIGATEHAAIVGYEAKITANYETRITVVSVENNVVFSNLETKVNIVP